MKQRRPLNATTPSVSAIPAGMVVVLTLFLTLILVRNPASASSYMERGMKEYSAGQYKQAITTLRLAIEREKSSDLAHYYLANSLMSTGNRNEAALEYKRAFMLATSESMANNCRRALKGLNVALPRMDEEDMKTRTVRANMTPYSVASVNELSELAGKRANSPKILESHRDGVMQFEAAPESTPDMEAKWDKWIEDFRLEFNTSLYRMMGPTFSACSGKVKVIFSVDSSGKLRGRILESTAPFFYEYYLLATVRKLDGAPVLAFPSGSSIPGYNFTMGWTNGPPKSQFNRNTMAELRRLGYQLRRNPLTGEQAVALRLGGNQANGLLTSKNTSAQLSTNNAAGMLTSQKAGFLPIPNFDAVVAGIVLPRKPVPELKAAPLSLEDSTNKASAKPDGKKIQPPTDAQWSDTKTGIDYDLVGTRKSDATGKSDGTSKSGGTAKSEGAPGAEQGRGSSSKESAK